MNKCVKEIFILSLNLMILACQTQLEQLPSNQATHHTEAHSASSTPRPSEPVAPMESSAPASSFLQLINFAGSGEQGFRDGPLQQAQFMSVQGSCSDASTGALYILDMHRVRKITSDKVLTLAGGEEGFQDGAFSEARFSHPNGCVVDPQGNVFILDSKNYRIRKLSSDGQVTTYLGSGEQAWADGPLLTAQVSHLNDITFIDDKLTFTDHFRVRQVQGNQLVTLNSAQQHSVSRSQAEIFRDSHKIQDAQFGDHLQITEQENGAFFIADTDLRMLFFVDASQQVSQIKPDPTQLLFTPEGQITAVLHDILYRKNQSQFIVFAGNALLSFQFKANELESASIAEILNQNNELLLFPLFFPALLKEEIYLYNSREYQIQKFIFGS